MSTALPPSFMQPGGSSFAAFLALQAPELLAPTVSATADLGHLAPHGTTIVAVTFADGVVIAGDRVPVSRNPRVAVADFLGAPAPFPVGPHILAGILQCPVYLIFSMRRGRRSSVYFEAFRDSVRIPRKDRDAALAVLAGDYARRLEHHTMQAPLEWFNFYDFWHTPELESPDASR